MRGPIIAVDFDGTVCDSVWPGTGEPIQPVIDMLMRRQQYDGAKLILWTCRTDDALDVAVRWCEQHGLVFDAVNSNLPELNAMYGNDSRKIFADEYIDDKAINALPYQSGDITAGNMLVELEQWMTHMQCQKRQAIDDGNEQAARSAGRSIQIIQKIMEEVRG